MLQVALNRLLQDSRLYEPLTPLALRPGNDAWPAAMEAMLETFFSSLVCCSTVDAVRHEINHECHRHQRNLYIMLLLSHLWCCC